MKAEHSIFTGLIQQTNIIIAGKTQQNIIAHKAQQDKFSFVVFTCKDFMGLEDKEKLVELLTDWNTQWKRKRVSAAFSEGGQQKSFSKN